MRAHLSSLSRRLATIRLKSDRLLVRHFNRDVVGPYWPPQRRLVEEAYSGIEFPFDDLQTSAVPMALTWSVEYLLA